MKWRIIIKMIFWAFLNLFKIMSKFLTWNFIVKKKYFLFVKYNKNKKISQYVFKVKIISINLSLSLNSVVQNCSQCDWDYNWYQVVLCFCHQNCVLLFIDNVLSQFLNSERYLMSASVPSLLVGWVNVFFWLPFHICFISQTQILSNLQISMCQSIWFNVMTFKNGFDFLCKLIPEFLWMLICSGKSKIIGKRTLFVLILIFENVDCNLSSDLWFRTFF